MSHNEHAEQPSDAVYNPYRHIELIRTERGLVVVHCSSCGGDLPIYDETINAAFQVAAHHVERSHDVAAFLADLNEVCSRYNLYLDLPEIATALKLRELRTGRGTGIWVDHTGTSYEVVTDA